jgi:hypothetical protein
VQTVQGCRDILRIPENAKTDDSWKEVLGTTISLKGEGAYLTWNWPLCVCVCVSGGIFLCISNKPKFLNWVLRLQEYCSFLTLSRQMSDIIRLAVQKMVTAVYSSSHLYWLICDPSVANCIQVVPAWVFEGCHNTHGVHALI